MFGSHLSVAGGLHNALLSAERLGMGCVQIFTKSPNSWGMVKVEPTPVPVCVNLRSKAGHGVIDRIITKNQQQWRCPPLDPEAANLWREHRDRLKFSQTVSHDSYLINLASPDDALWQKSIDLFVEELTRCAALGIPYLVTHPGAHMDSGEDAGLRRVARALDIIHGRVPRPTKNSGLRTQHLGLFPVTCLEITAGQGTCLGHRLEHLATIIDLVKHPDRLAVCLDTAHLFAAGYDFRGRRYAKFMRAVEATVTLDKVKVLHLNDSKKELGSRVDRHEHIGKGTIGLDGFRPFVRDKRWRDTPKILETAKGKSEDGRDLDAINLETLNSLM